MQAALAGLSPAALVFKPAPNEWSIHEVILPMADSELMGVTRLHMLIAQPGTMLMTYDSTKWGEALGYKEQSAEDALQIFQLLRRKTHLLLKRLPDQVFAHSVRHPAYPEPYTIDQWLEIYTGHVPEHIQQIQQTLKALKAAGQ